MKNKLGDLNNHLFAQLERLSDDLDAEAMEREVKRAQSIVAVSDQVIANKRLQLDVAKLWAAHGEAVMPMLPKIGQGE